ncbi:MAG: IclR family transcriptional regulator [Pseudomonadota bacterium]
MHLDRLMSVLEAVALAGRPVSPADLVAATGLPRPTCYRLIQSLTDQRLLDEPEPGRYITGARLLRLALHGQPDQDISARAAPILQEAAETFGDAVFLSRFRNKCVEIIHVETPRDATAAFIHPGLGFRPMHACSCSKAIAAFAEDTFREDILSGPLRSYTDQTKTNPEDLRAEFDAIRDRGFAECVEEIEVGITSVAAPVQVGGLGAVLSIGAIGSIRRFTDQRRDQIGRDLIGLANRTGRALSLANVPS